MSEIFKSCIPCVIYLCAPRKSGKSTLAYQMLTHPKMLQGKFDKIFIFSPTLMYQSNFTKLKLPKEQLFDEYDSDKVDEIIDEQKKMLDKKDDHQVLIIFDDCVASSGFKSTMKNEHPLNKISTIGRHFNISILIISQKVSGVSPTIRNNCDIVCLFRLSPAEQKVAYDSWPGSAKSFKEWQDIFDYCVNKEPYSFMTIALIDSRAFLFRRFNRIQT